MGGCGVVVGWENGVVGVAGGGGCFRWLRSSKDRHDCWICDMFLLGVDGVALYG